MRVQQRPAHPPRPFTGWALEATLRMDAVEPGFLRFVFLASPIRRAAIFFVLARVARGDLDDTRRRLVVDAATSPSPNALGDIARALKALRAKPIVTALWGSAPHDIVGILRRLGVIDGPFTNPASYESLRSILLDPTNRDRADVLRTGYRITETNVQVAAVLDPLLLSLTMVQSLGRVTDAVALGETLKLIRTWCPDATDGAIRMSTRSPSGKIALTDWCGRWMLRATNLPDPGLPLGPEFRLLNSGRDIREATGRYRNCLVTKGAKILLGRAAFYEHTPSQALVELKALSEGRWFLDGVHVAQNRPVPSELERAIQVKLIAIGVLVLVRQTPQGRRQAGIARLLGLWDDVDFEDDFLAVEAEA